MKDELKAAVRQFAINLGIGLLFFAVVAFGAFSTVYSITLMSKIDIPRPVEIGVAIAGAAFLVAAFGWIIRGIFR